MCARPRVTVDVQCRRTHLTVRDVPYPRLVGAGSALQFVSGKVEAVDARIVKRSERAVQLEQAHKAIVGRLKLDDYEIRPIPRPQGDK